MGMPCEVNSILKLKNSNGYPNELKLGIQYEAWKEDYRIIHRRKLEASSA